LEGTTVLSRTGSSSLDLSVDGDRAIIRLQDPQFGTVDREPDDEKLLASLVELPQSQLSLDFSNVRFVASLGLAMLLRLNKQLAQGGRRLVIVNLQPHVYEVFSLTYLNTVLDVRLSEAA
jgi:anti-anti-sigma factor